MKIGFIGLGNLGSALAKRLVAEGVDLTVWNRTKEKAAALGFHTAESPAALISSSDAVFLNLFDSEAVLAVLSGKGGILEGDCKGKLIIDTTTNHFGQVLEIHETMKTHNISYLEAPVLGSVAPALQGALTVLVSGDKAAFDRALGLIEKIGKNIFYLGEPALATKMKLVNNLVLASFMATIAEAVALGEDSGIEKAKILEILSVGAGNSTVLNAKKDKLLKEDFSAQFSSAAIYKDLHYLQDLAKTLQRPLFTGSMAKELFAMTYSDKLEDLDFSALYLVMKKF